MIYLLIMVVVAMAGILRLWLLQRKERAQLASIEDLRVSLVKVSNHPGIATQRVQARSRPAATLGPATRPAPLDPVRREAAKRRIEARRRARARAAS